MGAPALPPASVLRLEHALLTDAELDRLWVGSPQRGRLHPDADAWIRERARALRAAAPVGTEG